MSVRDPTISGTQVAKMSHASIPGIAQRPVDLLDGVLGQKAAGLGQRPANHRDG